MVGESISTPISFSIDVNNFNFPPSIKKLINLSNQAVMSIDHFNFTLDNNNHTLTIDFHKDTVKSFFPTKNKSLKNTLKFYLQGRTWPDMKGKAC